MGLDDKAGRETIKNISCVIIVYLVVSLIVNLCSVNFKLCGIDITITGIKTTTTNTTNPENGTVKKVVEQPGQLQLSHVILFSIILLVNSGLLILDKRESSLKIKELSKLLDESDKLIKELEKQKINIENKSEKQTEPLLKAFGEDAIDKDNKTKLYIYYILRQNMGSQLVKDVANINDSCHKIKEKIEVKIDNLQKEKTSNNRIQLVIENLNNKDWISKSFQGLATIKYIESKINKENEIIQELIKKYEDEKELVLKIEKQSKTKLFCPSVCIPSNKKLTKKLTQNITSICKDKNKNCIDFQTLPNTINLFEDGKVCLILKGDRITYFKYSPSSETP